MTDTPIDSGNAPVFEETPATEDWQADLASPDASERLAAVTMLAGQETASVSQQRALEVAAVQDEEPAVRQAALSALAASPFRRLYRQHNRLSPTTRRLIVAEIEQWAQAGLLPAGTAEMLRQRYEFDQSPAAVTPAAGDEPERPTLTQLLLSDVTIKVALYLGAFFVIAAAFILAAVVEVFRLPILVLTTMAFLGAALGLKRRLPQASFVLSTVFSFLLVIDAQVLANQIDLDPGRRLPFWMLVSFCLGAVWLGGTWIYRSRLFSLLAMLAGGTGMLLLGVWLDASPHLTVLLLQVAALSGLVGVGLLQAWQGQRFAVPLLLLVQLLQLGVLGASTVLLGAGWFSDGWPAGGWWAVISLTWLLAALFYAGSDGLTGWPVFPPLAVGALLPVPLLLAGLFSPEWQTVMGLAWLWGALLVVAGQAWVYVPWPRVELYRWWLMAGSAGLFAVAAAGGLWAEVAYGVAYLAGAAAIYLLATVHRASVFSWSGTLVAATLAYLSVFALPAVQTYEFYPGFILFWPLLALLAIFLVARRGLRAGAVWALPPLLLATVVGALLFLALLATGFDEPGRAALVWTLLAGGAALIGLLERQPLIGFGTSAGLAVALGYGLLWREQENWLPFYVLLALLYFAAGLLPAWLGHAGGWARVFRWSGLGLGFLVSLAAPLVGGGAGVIGTALLATCFAIEAFRLRNVWLGVPANFLYLVSYVTLLLELEVTEPQFFSIGAALLGFIMHYLLVRSGSSTGAFITGILSQVVLLGTSYVQMLANDQILFFFVLFFQALVVLGYGLVVRSRSLVIAPIIFVVLGVITVALGALAGIPALFLVGCTGLLLLLLGIVALLQRERLLSMTSRLGERLGGWQA